jgi:hypothetical protein
MASSASPVILGAVGTDLDLSRFSDAPIFEPLGAFRSRTEAEPW